MKRDRAGDVPRRPVSGTRLGASVSVVLWVGAHVLGAAAAHAQAPADDSAARERLLRERAAVQARYAQREADCRTRFAVTDCLNDAKRARRDALAPLRREEIALDDAQRRRRAAIRQDEIRSRAEAAQVRERAGSPRVPPTVPRAAGRAAPAPAAESASSAAHPVKTKAPPRPTAARLPPLQPTEAERLAREAEANERTEARQRSAQEHREEARRRNAEREAKGKRAAPLPAPASGALP
jgi:hypothetical protein